MRDGESSEPDGAVREPYFDFLDPGRLRLCLDASGRVRLIIDGNRCYLDVKAVRAFPLSAPDSYLGLLDAAGNDRVIGLIERPEELDESSRQILEQAVTRHYFLPNIVKVHSMREEFGAIYFDVQTDRGRRQFIAKGLRDAIEDLGDGEMLLPDVDGNRYHIRDWQRLDARSRRFLMQVI
jgi:hypothetical protein